MAALDLDLNPDTKALRVFGIAAAVFFGGLGTLAWHYGWIPATVAYAAYAVGALSLCFSLVFPPANRPLFIVLTLLAFPIGLVVSYVVLTILFFLVITPVALVFRLIGRDALRLRTPRTATYWVPYERRGTLERYFRQF